MKTKKLLMLLASTCLVLVLAVSPFMAACAAPAEPGVVDVAKLQKEIASLKKEVASGEKEVASLKGKITTAEAKASTSKKEAAASKKGIAALEKEKTAAEKEIASLEGKVSAAEKEIAKLEAAAPEPVKVITWRMQNYGGVKDVWKYMDVKYNVEEMSNGRLLIDWYNAAELVPSSEILDAVSTGIVEMGHGLGAYWTGTMPLGKLESPPMGWTDLSQAIRVWWTLGLLDLMRDEYAKHNVFFLQTCFSTPYCILSTKPARNLDDLRAMKIRATGAFGVMLGKLGISTIYLPFEEIYTSMATGIIDGALYAGSYCYWSNAWYEVAKYYNTSSFLTPYAGNYLVNMDAWNALTDDLRAMVQVQCDRQAIYSASIASGEELEHQQKLIAEGVTIGSLTDEAITEITEASAEYWAEVAAEGPECAKAVELLLQMKREYGIIE